MKSVALDLKGMFQVLTPDGLEQQIKQVDGIARVQVDPNSGETQIDFDNEVTSLKAIRWHLVECGYHCAMEVLPDEVCDPDVGKTS